MNDHLVEAKRHHGDNFSQKMVSVWIGGDLQEVLSHNLGEETELFFGVNVQAHLLEGKSSLFETDQINDLLVQGLEYFEPLFTI